MPCFAINPYIRTLQHFSVALLDGVKTQVVFKRIVSRDIVILGVFCTPDQTSSLVNFPFYCTQHHRYLDIQRPQRMSDCNVERAGSVVCDLGQDPFFVRRVAVLGDLPIALCCGDLCWGFADRRSLPIPHLPRPRVVLCFCRFGAVGWSCCVRRFLGRRLFV